MAKYTKSAKKAGLNPIDAKLIDQILDHYQAKGLTPPDLGSLLDSNSATLATMVIDLQSGNVRAYAAPEPDYEWLVGTSRFARGNKDSKKYWNRLMDQLKK